MTTLTDHICTGYNQGVFSGVLTMTSFDDHMGVWVRDSTKKGWLTSILELGAWVGTIYSGFLAEIISRKYAILVNTVSSDLEHTPRVVRWKHY